ncbi:MAG: hypothetical protein HC836_12735 [Richelia sp. RM2_1_2]|nr:hypothetical protein [Richelia sp. RM2_1_2]
MSRRKINTKKLKETDGKLREINKKSKNVNELFGVDLYPYSTTDSNVYEESIRKMNKIDLQEECIKNEEYPSDDREIMIMRLMKRFRIISGSRRNDLPDNVIKVSKEAERLMRALGGNY